MVDPTGHFAVVIPIIWWLIAAAAGTTAVAMVATQQAGAVSEPSVALPKMNSPAINLLGWAMAATVFVQTLAYKDTKAQEKEKDVAQTKEDDKKPKIVYRALDSKDRVTVDAGIGIDRYGSDLLMALEQHVGYGSTPSIRGTSPWISTTINPFQTKQFDKGNGIVAIDLNKVPSPYYYSFMEPFKDTNALKFSSQQLEVSIFMYVPQTAIINRWDTYSDFTNSLR